MMQNSNQGGEGDFAFPDDEFADYESVKVFYKLQQQWNPGNASAHDIYFSKGVYCMTKGKKVSFSFFLHGLVCVFMQWAICCCRKSWIRNL